MAGGGLISQLQSQQQTPMGGGSSPFNTGGGMSGGQTSSPTNFGPMVNYGQGNGGGFGGQQMPNFAAPQQPTQQGQSIPSVFTPEQFKPYANAPRTREEQHRLALELGHIGNPGDRYLQQQQQPNSSMVAEEYPTQSFGDMQYRPQQQPEMMMSDMRYRPERQQPFGGQFGQPMQNPFQPQQPSFMQNPEYQGYQTQAQNLSRQMDEYMKKAPMYQQLQDLQNKMAPFQQRHQQQEMQRMQQMQAMQQRQFQQPSPFRRGQFQQPAGIQGLMGMLGGRSSGRDIGSYEQYIDRNNKALASASQEVKQPTMSRAEWQAMSEYSRQPRMSMDMPYARGFASEPPTYFMKKGGKV